MTGEEIRTAKERLELASMLGTSALELMRSWRVQHAGDEMARRQIQHVAMAFAQVTRALLVELRKKRLRLGLEEVRRCPHCGWAAAPRAVPKCVRCLRPRELHHEAGEGDHRSASGT